MGLKLAKILYLITQHVHTTFKIYTSFISQNIPIEIFLMKKQPKIHIIMVCKILIEGVMVVKLGKILYVFTHEHVHTTFEISTSFISQNIPFEILFLFKNRSKIHIILVCKLYIYRAIDLKLGMLVYVITQHVHVYFQVSTALHI